jgi:mRNA-degrading endonuclease RelE of RelBE toxin-antitoxin system
MRTVGHTVAEMPTFLNDCRRAGLSEDEHRAITDAVAEDPQAGDIIKGTGGARKRRIAGRGKGKSGGYRVISYYAGDDVPVVLLALVDKGERADLSQAGRNEMRKLLVTYASEYRASAATRAARRRR